MQGAIVIDENKEKTFQSSITGGARILNWLSEIFVVVVKE